MILDGKAIATQIQRELAEMIGSLSGRKPCLAVLLVGNNPASHIYVNRKTKACADVGMTSLKFEFPSSITEKTLLAEIEKCNRDPHIDGILVQLPLPPQINVTKVTRAIHPEKDVDGFHPINVGKLLIGETDGFEPCTPLGIKMLLERSGIAIEGKHVVIVGRSNIVGKPLAAMLMQNLPGCNATVTVAHSKTKNLKKICLMADILIVAVGKPRTVTEDMVKQGATVIDVGINREDALEGEKAYRIVGDVDFEAVQKKCSFITPVPGGVGPMTIAMLLNNTWKSFSRKM